MGSGGQGKDVNMWMSLLGGTCGKSAFFPYGKSLKIRASEDDWWHKLSRSIFLKIPVLVFVRVDWPQDQFISYELQVLFISFIERAVFWRSRNISGMFMEKRIILRTSAELWQMTHKPSVFQLQMMILFCQADKNWVSCEIKRLTEVHTAIQLKWFKWLLFILEGLSGFSRAIHHINFTRSDILPLLSVNQKFLKQTFSVFSDLILILGKSFQ